MAMQAAKRPRHLTAAEAQQQHQEAQRRDKLAQQLHNAQKDNMLADAWDPDERMCEDCADCELWNGNCHPYR